MIILFSDFFLQFIFGPFLTSPPSQPIMQMTAPLKSVWVFLSEYVDCRMRSHPRLPGCGILIQLGTAGLWDHNKHPQPIPPTPLNQTKEILLQLRQANCNPHPIFHPSTTWLNFVGRLWLTCLVLPFYYSLPSPPLSEKESPLYLLLIMNHLSALQLPSIHMYINKFTCFLMRMWTPNSLVYRLTTHLTQFLLIGELHFINQMGRIGHPTPHKLKDEKIIFFPRKQGLNYQLKGLNVPSKRDLRWDSSATSRASCGYENTKNKERSMSFHLCPPFGLFTSLLTNLPTALTPFFPTNHFGNSPPILLEFLLFCLFKSVSKSMTH
ncbi:putative signal peptide protein [Puccinia sorghi]|uniref:Putative signal peptide protein n=1 Tax=Puccinia sorghi TaxID=27349 RepID=A0A0L6VII0_9BASI|nr:putative signal peptide protein [Puccinia sorghi]